jgi:hypothetical protein
MGFLTDERAWPSQRPKRKLAVDGKTHLVRLRGLLLRMRNPRTDFFRIRLFDRTRFETTLYLLVRHPSLGRGIEITNRV